MLRLVLPTFALLALAVPAAAHSGGHESLSLYGLLSHLAESDHLALLAVAGIVGWLAWRHVRRVPGVVVKAKARSERRHDPR